jgi:hypothetical protein
VVPAETATAIAADPVGTGTGLQQSYAAGLGGNGDVEPVGADERARGCQHDC